MKMLIAVRCGSVPICYLRHIDTIAVERLYVMIYMYMVTYSDDYDALDIHG